MQNNNLDLGYHPIYNNYGFYIDKVSDKVLKELTLQVNTLKNNPNPENLVNYELEGEIQHEYNLIPQLELTNYIKTLTTKIENKSKYISTYFKTPPILSLPQLWVNFQQKYEYNPIHSHGGVYSFVIWYQIPYTVEEELNYSYKHPNQTSYHGSFSFVYPNFSKNLSLSNLDMYNLFVDKNTEGYVAIFPSTLNHCVYPFYSSDDYRITIAGNIKEI